MVQISWMRSISTAGILAWTLSSNRSLSLTLIRWSVFFTPSLASGVIFVVEKIVNTIPGLNIKVHFSYFRNGKTLLGLSKDIIIKVEDISLLYLTDSYLMKNKFKILEIIFDLILTLSPHIYLLSMLFYINSFKRIIKTSSILDNTKAFYSINIIDGLNQQDLKLKDEILDKYIFYQWFMHGRIPSINRNRNRTLKQLSINDIIYPAKRSLVILIKKCFLNAKLNTNISYKRSWKFPITR
ncbi:hypothetical protein DPV78_000135 [Talaromyces pinophilus]|nr:hypothetical protein DPV78_000135 [Talaromyces pinophilus]